ncbi:hypothetical protein [Virgibacillus sp. L01]|uniref:hypothetical protein n=1 Tax=Virgibacillus sp. L01 TaxID=3457429 RepID=UPI003FD46879
MEKKYSNHTLFNCAIKDFIADKEKMQKGLQKSLELLSTVLKFINKEAANSNRGETIKSLEKYKRINDYNGELPPFKAEHWTIEEMTLLIIMLRATKQKKYDSMKKTVEAFISKEKAPSQKVIDSNLDWLLEAYKCMGLLKHTTWSEKITKEMVQDTFGKKVTAQETLVNIREVETAIINSEVLDAELDSIIAQILVKCAYPELLVENKIGLSVQLVDAVSEMILAVESVNGVNNQRIVVNESIKHLQKLSGLINSGYDISKYYTDSYWENLMKEEQFGDKLNEIKKVVTKKYAVELDTIEKNTL